MNHHRFLTLLLFTLIFWTCGERQQQEKPGPPMAEDTFIRLYVQAMAIRLYTTPVSRADSALVELYKEYGLTKRKFEQLVAYYQEDPDRWKRVVEEADRKVMQLIRQQRSRRKSKSDSTVHRDPM